MEITHYSQCDADYTHAVKTCKTLDELKTIVTEYRELTEDAHQIVQKMDDTQFEDFCKQRNRSKVSLKWMEQYGPVLLPRQIIHIGLTASRFNVPFGTAYHRLKDLGRL